MFQLVSLFSLNELGKGKPNSDSKSVNTEAGNTNTNGKGFLSEPKLSCALEIVLVRPSKTEGAFGQTVQDRNCPWLDSTALDDFRALELHSSPSQIRLKSAWQFLCSQKDLRF